MKRIVIMALKDLKLLWRDKVGMFFMIAFPIIMGVFFGSVMGGGGSNSEASKMKIALVDHDASEMSKKFVASLVEAGNLDIVEMEFEEAKTAVRMSQRVAMVAIPKGFGETAGIMWAESPAIQVGADPSRQAEAAMLEGFIMQSMGGLMGERFQDTDSMRSMVDDAKTQIEADKDAPITTRLAASAMMSTLDTFFDSVGDLQQETDGNGGPFANGMQLANVERIDVTRQQEPNGNTEELKKVQSKWDISFPQSMMWGVLSCVAGFAILIVRERTIGTLTRLQVAPISRPQILAGKALGCFISVVLVLSLLIAVACVLPSGMRPKRWDLLGLATVSIAFCFTGLMLPLSLLGKTEQAVSGMVWAVCVLMAMLGGGMVPVMFMPDWVQKISNFDPVRWASLSMEGAIWREFTLVEMLAPCGIMLGIGAVSMAIGSVIISKQTA